MRNFIKIFLLLNLYILIFSTTSFASFNDVENHWCENEILDFQKSGFVQGYQDGSFKPNNEITRAEFSKIVNSYMGYEVSGEWKESNMNVAKEKGYLTVGNADDFISREEAFVVLSRVMKVESTEVEIDFIDANQISAWALPLVKGMTESGYIKGYENNELRPKNNMCRAELVKVLYNYVGEGGLDDDIEEVQFSIGYMNHNEYGLEYVEAVETVEIELEDTLLLAATCSEEDGDVEYKVIRGNDKIEFDAENGILTATKKGRVTIKGVTTSSKKEKKMFIEIK